jgi:hypothetical protein
MHTINAHNQRTQSTHTINAHNQRTQSTHAISAHNQRTQSKHTTNAHNQRTQSTHTINTHNQRIFYCMHMFSRTRKSPALLVKRCFIFYTLLFSQCVQQKKVYLNWKLKRPWDVDLVKNKRRCLLIPIYREWLFGPRKGSQKPLPKRGYIFQCPS